MPEKAALIASAIFAVHPFQAEPVNYIFARSIVLATVFCLAALVLWTRGRLWWAVGCFALALLAKEECAAFPVFLLLLHFSGQRKRSELTPIGVMLILSFAAGVRVMLVGARIAGSGIGEQSGVSWQAYALTQGEVILRYLRMLVLPLGFTVDPDVRVPPVAIGLLAWLVVLVLAGIGLFRLRPTGPWFWFLAGLVLLTPSSSILPAADLAADRRLYLPMIAFAACAGLLLARLRPVWPGLVVLVLACLSVQRTAIWRTERSLWSDAVEKAPDKIRPKIQLARAVDAPRALEILESAKLYAPDDARIPAEEGRVYLGLGEPSRALLAFGQSLALAPHSADAFNNRGAALLALDQKQAAREDFERALAIDPCGFNPRLNLRRMGIARPAPLECKFSAEESAALGGN